jgi:hypothetical protein
MKSARMDHGSKNSERIYLVLSYFVQDDAVPVANKKITTENQQKSQKKVFIRA